MKKSEETLNSKYKLKEEKLLNKFIAKKSKKEKKYMTKKALNKKVKNAQSFLNTDFVRDDGVVSLKNHEYAKILSVDAIDLSLTSNTQKQNFFMQLRYLFQIKNLDLRIYKLDDKIDLNLNKDYYKKLIDQFKNDKEKVDFLSERYARFEILEQESLTTTSRYYFVVISDNEKLLNYQIEEIQMQCYNMTPKLNVKVIENKMEIYQFLINLYFSHANLEQLLWCNLTELISPFFIEESINHIKFDDNEVQLVMIKNLPPFIDELYLEELFNIPDTRCCIHIKDTISTETIIKRLDSNYEMLTSERMTTRKLSDATQMDTEKENFKELMNQIKNGDEKIKEINFVVAITGNKKQREETIKEMKKIADIFQIKLEVPRMRQYEAWQSFDITSHMIEDYKQYLPTTTLAASFPLTITNFNDPTGYILGTDIHTALPIIFDVFHKDTSRPSSNLAIIASTGGGKSFTLKKIIVNEINRGNKVFIFDAEGEYKDLVTNTKGGQYIDLYSASGGIINPLQVRFLPSDKEEKEDVAVDKMNYNDCPLAKHLSSLETFIKCAFEDIKEKEVVVLLDMIEKLYQRFGITKNTTILKLENLEPTDYPIFSDLIEFIPEYRLMVTNDEKKRIVDQLEILLERFKVGIDSMLFNGYTTVDLSADLIAFNVKDLLYSKNKRIITTQLVNLLTYFNNIIVSNKIINDKADNQVMKNIAIIVDEFHLYLKNTDSDVILTFEQIARRIRKYHGNFIPTTQSIRDFLGENESIRSATAIFNNCQYQLVGMLKDDDFTTYLKLFYQNPLTDTQKEFLAKAEQGEFLLTVTNKKRLRLKIMATAKELELMGEKI